MEKYYYVRERSRGDQAGLRGDMKSEERASVEKETADVRIREWNTTRLGVDAEEEGQSY